MYESSEILNVFPLKKYIVRLIISLIYVPICVFVIALSKLGGQNIQAIINSTTKLLIRGERTSLAITQ